MKLVSAAVTTIGLIRKRNEDRYVCDDSLKLYAVADGIGGLPAGEAAAQRAIDQLVEGIPKLDDASEKSFQKLIQIINHSVCRLAEEEGHESGIGTTLTFLLNIGKRFCLVHLGDSACFRLRAGKLEKLTINHTVETELLKLKLLGQTVPFVSERSRHALVRCIGQPGLAAADVSFFEIIAEDRFLICSDGLSEQASERELHHLLADVLTPKECVDASVVLATEQGGVDNMTAVAVFAA